MPSICWELMFRKECKALLMKDFMPTKKYILYLMLFVAPIFSAAQTPIVSKFAQISNLIEKYYVDSINFDSLEKKNIQQRASRTRPTLFVFSKGGDNRYE